MYIAKEGSNTIFFSLTFARSERKCSRAKPGVFKISLASGKIGLPTV